MIVNWNKHLGHKSEWEIDDLYAGSILFPAAVVKVFEAFEMIL